MNPPNHLSPCPPASLSFECQALIAFVLFLLGAVVYGLQLGQPAMMFWDENYHIASAQKYLAGMMFMEPHPPLGKLLMALSEHLFGWNQQWDLSEFLKNDHTETSPKGYIFLPARLPSAIFMALSVPLFYGVIVTITRRVWLALLFTLFFLLDNALIVHGRAAHLEGACIFFGLWALLLGVRGLYRNQHRLRHYVFLALPIGLALATKANMGVLLLLPFAWWIQASYSTSWQEAFRSAITNGAATVLVVSTIVVAVYGVHFSLSQQVLFDRTYKASPEYLDIVRSGQGINPRYWPLMLRDTAIHMADYNQGVPRLRPYVEAENGAHPLLWPFGIKSINYRWDKGKDGRTRYLQLTANPVGWLVGLLGLVMLASLLFSKLLGESNLRPSVQWPVLLTLLGSWVLYITSATVIPRVLYLYHYFIPLIFTWCMGAGLCAYLLEKPSVKNRRNYWIACGVLLAVLQAYSFSRYMPLTYHLPLSPTEFKALIPTSLWGMRVIQ